MKAACQMLVCLLAGLVVHAGEPKVTLEFREPWNDVPVGKEAVYNVVVTSQEALQGTIGWRLSADNRTLARQEQELNVRPGQPAAVAIRLAIPAVKAGVVLNATLSVAVIEKGAGPARATLEKTLWVFPEDAFADRREWLKKLELRLFDPEKKTGERFEKANIAFKRLANLDAITEIKDGVLIVGEGVSFNDYKALPDLLIKAAARGVPVLCLAAAGGNLRVPGIGESDLPVPRNLAFHRSEIITKLDKRLDAAGWPPAGAPAGAGLTLRSSRSQVLGEVEKGVANWTWVEVTFNEPRGKFVLCQFGIIEKWEAGPAPAFLLARILEYLTADKQKTE